MKSLRYVEMTYKNLYMYKLITIRYSYKKQGQIISVYQDVIKDWLEVSKFYRF